jgi:hypothetical protein
MKMLLIPPYSNANIDQTVWEQELLDQLRQKGQLADTEIDIAEGYKTEHNEATRDAEFTALITVGAIRLVKEYGSAQKYDAIVVGGAYEPGFFAARCFPASRSPIP